MSINLEENILLLNKITKKAKTPREKTKLLYLITLNTPPALKALQFITQLDKLIAIYISPTGVIGVNGFKDGLVNYKQFHPC